MTGIFLRRGASFVALREQRYEAETVLQELIAKHPEMLAGDDAEHGNLLLVRREAGVSEHEAGAPRWSFDHLYLDAVGVPTLVEVKRSSDTRAAPRSRRADARLRGQRGDGALGIVVQPDTELFDVPRRQQRRRRVA